ncbi:ligand-gated channel protein [Onishia taeanensis]
MASPYRKTLLGLAVAGFGATAQAADEVALDDVVVTAAGYEQQTKDAPASISVLTREDLEARYYRDVTDALRDVPGVIVTGGGASKDISLRGMPADYTLLLVDGKPQSSRETRPNSDGPGIEQGWLPPLAAIERIEVVRGPMSTLYGSNAIGGVINVITRKVAEDWHGNLQTQTILQEDSASGDSQQTNVYLSGPLAPGLLGLQVYGQTSARDEDEIPGGYAESDLGSLTARLTLTASDDHDVALEAGRSEQTRVARLGASAASANDAVDQDYTREHLALSHDGRWDIGTSESYVQREVSENTTREMTITTTTAKSSLVMPLADHIVTLGASLEEERLEDKSSNQASDLEELDATQWALFVEDEWMLARDWSLTGGLRLDDNENYGSHISPRLYSVWNLAPRWTLKGGVSTGYRSPSLRELSPGWAQISRSGNVYGNPDLEPETSLNKELGLLYAARGGLDAGITVFHNDFKDKITRIACPSDVCNAGPNQFGADPTYRINVDEAVTQGVELSLSTPLGERVEASASYTYTDSEQKTGEYEGEPLTQLPKHLATLSLDWQATQRLSPWARVTYRGEESQPTTGPSQDAIVAPSYTFVDTGLGYQLTEQAKLNLGVYNLFDKDVGVDDYGYVEDGRRYWLGLNIDF